MNQIVAVVISYDADDVLNATPSDSLSFFDTEEEFELKKELISFFNGKCDTSYALVRLLIE